MNHEPTHDADPGRPTPGVLDLATLDAERAQLIGHQLAAAVTLPRAQPAPARPVRLGRVAGGVAAAAILGIGAVTVTTLTDRPAPASAAVRVDEADGWMSVDFIDTGASAGDIRDQLIDAGIDAEIADLADVIRSEPDDFTIDTGPPAEGRTQRYVGILELSNPGGSAHRSGPLSGILVELPEPIPSVALDPGSGPDAWAARTATLERLGVRIPLSGSAEVSIRKGADVTVLLVER